MLLLALFASIFFQQLGAAHMAHAPAEMAPHALHATHDMATMHGMYGRYAASQESTGTSWEPQATHMPGIHRQHGNWQSMFHGFATIIYDHQGGRRGGEKFFSENMVMLLTQRDFGASTFGLRGMFSLEPITMGKKGYPLLLQTGETANGVTPFIDRQHPHDLFMELAMTYCLWLPKKSSYFFYFGLPGEPALGPPMFMHRFSAVYNPEAPITHHWLDSTHICFGVATMGFVFKEKWKIDASVFNGREPDQHRFDIERPRFDSYSIRLSYNPTEQLAAQLSYGFLKSPEQLEPLVDIGRTTASLTYHTVWENNQWQTMLAYGRNAEKCGRALNGILLESTVELCKRHIIFGRAEWVEKNELFCPSDKRSKLVFKVGKINAGYIREVPLSHDFYGGIGFCGSVSFVPASLKKVYGGTPFSYMLFLRVELRQ